MSPSVQTLRTDVGQREERHSGSISDIHEAQTAILQGNGDLAVKLETAEALRGAVAAHARELRDMRENMEPLARLKLVGRVTKTVRRLRLSLASTFPLRDVFARTLVNLRAAAQVPPG